MAHKLDDAAIGNPPPGRPLGGAAAWRGAELRASGSWLRTLSSGEIEELVAAAERVRDRGLALTEVDARNFELPTLAPQLAELLDALLDGRGFVVLRGLPVAELERETAALIFWGIGRHLGAPVVQNARGHLLGHVTDLGYDADDPRVRIYQTRERQGFHTDSADVVALLCLRPAREGGLSRIASCTTAHDVLFERAPELAATLFEAFATDHRGEHPPGTRPYFEAPVLSHFAGELSVLYQRRYIESAQRFAGAPRLDNRRRAALDAFDAVLEDPTIHLEMELAPGDIQLIHNHQLVHDRTAFVDWDDPARKRHLLRLWLCPARGRPLPPWFAERYGQVEIGRRGGIRDHDRPTAPLTP